MNWYKLASKPYNYIGQCDKLRHDMLGEEKWKNMMAQYKKVSKEELEANCNLQVLLDEDESLDDFVADDPTAYFAKSVWGNKPCYYIMTHGFEFIFARD